MCKVNFEGINLFGSRFQVNDNNHRLAFKEVAVYSLVFVSIEKIYQTLETVFHWLSKHLEFCQKISTARHILNSLLGVWISR